MGDPPESSPRGVPELSTATPIIRDESAHMKRTSGNGMDARVLDLRISLFAAALHSLKRHTYLKFPVLNIRKSGEADDEFYDRLVCFLKASMSSVLVLPRA